MASPNFSPPHFGMEWLSTFIQNVLNSVLGIFSPSPGSVTINGALTVTGTVNSGTTTGPNEILTAAAPTVAASQVGLGATTAATATAGAGVLPAAPTAFLIINVAGTLQKIPYYNA